jgi:hypothetical protein
MLVTFQTKKEMKLHEKNQTTHSPMSKSRSKFKAVPKKKRKRGDVSNVPNKKKERKPHEKNQPTTHLAMSKSRSKSKTVPKKKKERER